MSGHAAGVSGDSPRAGNDDPAHTGHISARRVSSPAAAGSPPKSGLPRNNMRNFGGRYQGANEAAALPSGPKSSRAHTAPPSRPTQLRPVCPIGLRGTAAALVKDRRRNLAPKPARGAAPLPLPLTAAQGALCLQPQRPGGRRRRPLAPCSGRVHVPPRPILRPS